MDPLNVLKVLEAQEATLKGFIERHDATAVAVQDRMQKLEQHVLDLDTPMRGVVQKAGSAPYTSFATPQGPAYLLSAECKAADVLKSGNAPVSFDRWLGALVAGQNSADAEARDFVVETKSLSTGTSGVLIPTQYVPEWIDLLRANMVLNRAGMRTIPMAAKVMSMAALTGDPTVSWHSEAGSISASDPTFAARSLTAQTLVARVQISVELAQDSPGFGQQLLSAIARAMAAEIDRVGLVGTGSAPEPHGIYLTSGINTVTGVGTPTNYSEILSGVQKLLEANVALDVATRYAIMSPRSWATYEGLVTGISSDLTPLTRPQALRNTEFLISSNVPNNVATSSPAVDSLIFLGDFRSLLMGVRQDPVLKILELDTYASNLQLEVVAYTRVDFCVTRPLDFCVLSGVKA